MCRRCSRQTKHVVCHYTVSLIGTENAILKEIARIAQMLQRAINKYDMIYNNAKGIRDRMYVYSTVRSLRLSVTVSALYRERCKIRPWILHILLRCVRYRWRCDSKLGFQVVPPDWRETKVHYMLNENLSVPNALTHGFQTFGRRLRCSFSGPVSLLIPRIYI